jgi:serine/threonine protein kinase
MAIVYRAYDCVLQRTVALKVLLPHLASNKEFTRRFRREAITAANLRHPNIVIIYDVGSYENFQYIVMEYLEGPTLQDEIQEGGAVPISQAVSILGQLAGALDYAHQQELVHRDIKPANIIIGREDRVTLTDFGLVKAAKREDITGDSTAVGTLMYMSPEQVMGKAVNGLSDIYSLGVVVYEMLSGEVPFSGTTPYQIIRELVEEPPPSLSRLNPQIDPGVEQVVLKALAKEPGRRFQTAGEFAQEFAGVTGFGVAAHWTSDTDSLKREVLLHLTTSDGREFPVYQGETTVGRDTGNDIILPVQQVSRYHARIYCEREGYHLVDLGSTNGTFVNGVQISPEVPWSLRPNDVLKIGPVKLTVTQPSPGGQQADLKTLSMPRNL